ncbi:jg20006 [Pararge aegeria aegeria]|uniref:Jg20006 protein n=1 Tax=Pararge aegeria aegeria TaxID=348720 RepID=A0A8S4R3W9_9NEOP|nr:jg20006 [Pararge aegeria aegeria]
MARFDQWIIGLPKAVPKVEIVDERGRPLQDKFYKEGSIIELRCVVSEVPQPARQVNWKHGGRLLNYDTKRGGVSVKTEASANGALSRLYIANANRNDSGNYTCSLADVAASAVFVHVLRGSFTGGANSDFDYGGLIEIMCTNKNNSASRD